MVGTSVALWAVLKAFSKADSTAGSMAGLLVDS
jgi:hypothetical protein